MVSKHTPSQIVLRQSNSQQKTHGSWRTSKPDTDNLEKALKDEMTRLHFWHDDAQVCSEIVEKFWSDPCGVFVRVEVWG